jgi:hypothetical protein
MKSKYAKLSLIIMFSLAVILFIGTKVTFADTIITNKESEENGSIAQATKITFNDYWKGNICDRYDTDYYGFSVDNDGIVKMKFEHDQIDKDFTKYWRISLIDENKNEYTKVESAGEDKSVEFQVAVKKGVYYVKIVPYSRDVIKDIEYRIMVNVDKTDYYEKEMNNTANTATRIELNKPYTGKIASISDVDYYRFELNGEGLVKLKFNNKYTENDSIEHWNVELLDNNEDEIQNLKIKGEDKGANLEVGLPKGIYYIKVYSPRSDNQVDTEYTVEADYSNAKNYEEEPNDTEDRATNLNLNVLFTGKLSNNDDIDYYRFKLNENGNVRINFYHGIIRDESGDYWKITLTDSNKNKYIYFYSNAEDGQTYRDIGLRKGTYYLRVEPYSASDNSQEEYQIGVTFTQNDYCEIENNNEYNSATNMEFNSGYVGRISDKFDVDYYKFKLDQEKNVVLAFNPSSADDWKVAILNSNGRTVAYRFDPDNDVNEIVLSKGTYYVRVEPNDRQNFNSSDYYVSVNVSIDVSYLNSLIDDVANTNSLYRYNLAYEEIIKVKAEAQRDELLGRLSSLYSNVFTDEIKNINDNLQEMSSTGSGRIYDEIQGLISNSNITEEDKSYLLGEVTGWGKNLVWTDDYKDAVDALNQGWAKKDIASLRVASNKISVVQNQYSKDYLVEELNKLKQAIV